MKIQFIFLLALITQGSVAQTRETYGLLSFLTPKGWTKGTTKTTVSFTHTDKVKKAWCQMIIYEKTTSKGNADLDFDNEWKEIVTAQYPAAGKPQKGNIISKDEWKFLTGNTVIKSGKENMTVSLTSISGFNSCISFLARTTHNDYTKDIENFVNSFQLQKPSISLTNENNPAPNPVNSTYTFNISNFDDGWVSTVQNEYVLVEKSNNAVYINYSVPYNASQFSGTGVRDAEYYWDNYVTKLFTTKTKQFNDGSSIALKPPYMEGNAIDKRTGKSCFIGMYLNIIPNAVNIIIGTAPNEAAFRQLFPKANDPFGSDLSAMTRYNKFAVAPNDLIGKWQNGNTETAHWYYISPAGYEGYAGMTVASTSATFNFNSNGKYTSIHNGATGAVGNMGTFQQEFKGTYTATNWMITATNHYGGKTDKFDASFVAVRGGRILKLNNNAGQEYNLVRIK